MDNCKKYNLLIMANYSPCTGFAWNNIYGLFNALAGKLKSNDNICTIISFAESCNSASNDRFSNLTGTEYLLPNSLRIKQLYLFWKTVKEHKISHLYLTDQKHYHLAYLCYRLLGIKKIVVHNRISVASPDIPSKEFFLKRSIKSIMSRMPLVNCDHVIAVSEFVKYRLVHKSRLPSARVSVILNGINTKIYYPDESQSKSLKKTSDPIVIFAGGRASIHKGFQYLFNAIQLLKEKHNINNINLKYAGGGPDLDKLKSLVNSLGISEQVEFLGELKNTASLQRSSDIIVVPSSWGDACPSAVMEAMACGKPLITTNAGGIPEIVGTNSSAIVVQYESSVEIADAIAAIINNSSLATSLASNARKRAVNNFSLDRYHEEVYSKLCVQYGYRNSK